jgi:hypothetical protein
MLPPRPIGPGGLTRFALLLAFATQATASQTPRAPGPSLGPDPVSGSSAGKSAPLAAAPSGPLEEERAADAGPTGAEALLGPPPRLALVQRPSDLPPPVIDGVLDDPLWAAIEPESNFRQVLPLQNGPPSERTELRVAHDGRTLFVAVRCLDSDPAGVRGTQMRRDANLDPDDRVELLLDPFDSRRDAFWFQIGPAGGKGDALIGRNGSRFEKSWDGIFDAASALDERGWSAEFAIPFATTGFSPDAEQFGFNLRRFIRRKEEVVQWARPLQRIRFFSVADAGLLTGVGPLEPSLGLDLKPFGVARLSRDDQSGDQDLTGDVGLDVFWRLAPSTKLSLSFNTDFAETEADARQVNLTRFPLFFPERRDFFLEDSSAFLFGPPTAFGGGSDLIPFFSRRIGLDADGQAVPLLAAAKLTSTGEGYTLGLLDVQTGDSGDLDGRNLAVARASFDLFERSDIGVIATAGDPSSTAEAATLGADLNLRTERFLSDRNLRFSSYVVTTPNEGGGDRDLAWAAELDYPNDTVDLSASFVEIGEDVDPALGFVPRVGIRRYEGEFRLQPRPGTWIRQIGVGYFPTLVTDRRDNVQSERHAFTLMDLRTESGERAKWFVQRDREVLLDPFEIADGVEIAVGDYDWWRTGVSFNTSDRRPWDFSAALELGDFWDGRRQDVELELGWRPNRHLSLELEYEFNDVTLASGAFDVHLGRLKADLALTRELSIQNFLQWDSQSDQMGLNTRLRWIVEPGNELFFVIDQAWDTLDGRISPGDSRVATKLGWTFRF